MTEWISYKDLYNRYSEGGIIHLFRKGLQPYDENYEDVYCLYEHHEYSHVYNNYSPQDPYRSQRLHEIVDNEPELSKGYIHGKIMKLSWKFVWVPKNTQERDNLFSRLKNTQFKKENIEKIQSSYKNKAQKRKREKAAHTQLIEKTISELIKLNKSVPKTKIVIFAIINRQYDPQGVLQEYDEKEEKFLFNNPETRKEYKPVKLKSIKNSIAKALSRYK